MYFDFHGALRQLLPSLLPRLYATLQRDEPTLRGKMLCQETGRTGRYAWAGEGCWEYVGII